ncbi:MAG: hypothetical protein A2Y04_02515 [Omnitrophica WOR_2 bacterium GWC2_45_7]|nr:MAG: hypothetical protein A2Z81_06590 [Omnitrophica WOR_2 bacterium GWA2_45_18]OGX21273.1 MAG: hypothetical protein A2Y04_02515 [Omnitrophica WOR_2 bacterium GWC2_45_7]
MNRYFDGESLVVMAITLGLFVTALFVKGFTHDLLLEAGIFLISVKIIMAGYRNHRDMSEIKARLDELKKMMER